MKDIDLYTEKQYNSFGWVRANDVLTVNEYEHFTHEFANYKKLKHQPYGYNPETKEAIIRTGDDLNTLNVYVYVRGSLSYPEITKVVRLKTNDIVELKIIEEVYVDANGTETKNSYENVRDVFGNEFISSFNRQDLPTFQEYRREQKRDVGGKGFENTELNERRGPNRTGNNETKAELDDSAFSNAEKSLKEKQLDIILKNNPANDNYHTWIRKTSDILTFEETLQDSSYEGWEEDGFAPDYDGNMAKKALETGKITVYSSYPIKQGVFVTPSRMEAESYAGSGKIYQKTVSLNDVAWIDPTQGQFARVDNSDVQNMLDLNPEGFKEDGSYFYVDENDELTYIGKESLQKELRKSPKYAGLNYKIMTTRKTGGLLKGYKPITPAGVSRRWLSLCSSLMLLSLRAP